MTSMAVWVRGVFQRTVWGHVTHSGIPRRFMLIYTAVLPFKYAMLGLYGSLTIGHSVSSIDLVFGPIYGDIWSIALTVAGFTSLVGVVFYNRLIWVEAFGAVLLVTLMILYIGAIFMAATLGAEQLRIASLLLVMIFLPMPSWRVYDIVRELRPPRHV